MVDVLVSSGLPKPWHAHQKEPPALSSGFISGYFASSPETSSTGHFAPYTRRALSKSATHCQKRCFHLRRKGRMQCLSKDNMENMSHAQSSIEHHPSAKGLLDYIPEQNLFPYQTGLSSSGSGFMTAPVMKTTSSCNSLDHMMPSDLPSYLKPFSAPPTNTPTAMIPAMSTSDMDWTAKPNSLYSTTEDTPSISPSLEFINPKKEDSPLYQGLYPQDETFQAVTKAALPVHGTHLDYSTLPIGANEASWSFCSATSDPDPWHQPYVSGNITDEQAWASTEYLPIRWPGPESNQDTLFVNSPSMQSYEAYQQIQLPMDNSHNHNHNHNYNPILRHPSTPIPSDSDIEHPAQIPQALETLPAHPHRYQTYHEPNPCSQDPNPSLLPQSTDYHQPPIPPSTHTFHPEERSIKASLHYSDSRNAFLIDCKQRGLSYKDIKRIGGFKEAESTLRGRFRTLTKTKEQRVRKPKWIDRDIKLLWDAVAIYTEPSAGTVPYGTLSSEQPPKVSWKKVAQHIWANGGSYQFGNATCKKKWCEIHNIKI